MCIWIFKVELHKTPTEMHNTEDLITIFAPVQLPGSNNIFLVFFNWIFIKNIIILLSLDFD